MSGSSDAFTDFLKRGIGPRVGMWRIPLPTQSYQHPSVPLSSQRLLNLMLEAQPDGARAPFALVPTPGLVAAPGLTFVPSLPEVPGTVLAVNTDFPGTLYAVVGQRFYRMVLGGGGVPVVTNLGYVGTPTGPDYAANLMVSIAVGVNGAVVCVPPNAYTCTHTGGLNQIGGTFPGARFVTYIDGYFVFTSNTFTSNFFTCLLMDPTMYDALDFAYADGVPNVLRGVFTVHDELWFAGDKGMEVWWDAGAVDFPFRRQVGGIIPYGLLSIKTACLCDKSLFWVADTCIVYRGKGYQAVRISTTAIEAIIEAGGANTAQWAYSYVLDGHSFYCLTISGVTLVYDVSNGLWHNRSSAADGTGTWRPSCAAQLGSQVLLGDSLSPNCFNAIPRWPTDSGVLVFRQVVLPQVWGGTDRAFMNRVEVEMEVGGAATPGPVLLEWSNDGGVTFTGSRELSAGTALQLQQRVFATRLGSFHSRVLRLTAQGVATFYAVDADITNLLQGG